MRNKRQLALLVGVLLCVLCLGLVSCGEPSTQTDAVTGPADTTTDKAPDDSMNTTDPVGTGDANVTGDPSTGEGGTTVPPEDTASPADTSSEGSTQDTSLPIPDTTKEPEVTVDPDELTNLQAEALEWCDNAYKAAQQGQSLPSDSKTQNMSKEWSKLYSVVCGEMQRYYVRFLNGDMSYDSFVALMKSFSAIPDAKGQSAGYVELAGAKREDIDHLEAARTAVSAGKFMRASVSVSKIDKADFARVQGAKDLIYANKDSFKAGITEAVTEYMVRYEIAEGRHYLEALRGMGIDGHIDAEVARLEEYRKFQEEGLVSVRYSETLENIYTHCLIAYPEINFASKSTYGNCGTDCLTPYEFTFLLESLYERGYIIIDANLVYNAEDETFYRNISLPEGKKPLIFTFDDVTYDSRKDNRGMIDKLIVDEDGYVCTYTKHKDGSEEVRYDNELFPILDAFVREHPDFTFRGARGTLFFTGFDGICGYRTQSEPVDAAEAALKLDRQAEIAGAKVVIEALREEGWTFGCHGYNHSHMSRLSYSSFKKEIDMWREEVGAIVGDTGLFCWPFGDHGSGEVRKGDRHEYMFEQGFYFFFGCGSARYLSNELDSNGIFSDRKGVTGQVLCYIAAEYRTYLRDYPYLFDTEKIWDPLRLPYKDWLLSKL